MTKENKQQIILSGGKGTKFSWTLVNNRKRGISAFTQKQLAHLPCYRMSCAWQAAEANSYHYCYQVAPQNHNFCFICTEFKKSIIPNNILTQQSSANQKNVTDKCIHFNFSGSIVVAEEAFVILGNILIDIHC